MGMSDEEEAVYEDLNNLKNQLKATEDCKVVLIGDIMMDCYIHGYANNLNSRAPVPVLRETMREEDVGAAAHVGRGLNSMGLQSHLFGVVGDDRAGLNILQSLDEEGVATEGIAIIDGRTTTVKTRLLATRESLVSDEQLLLRWDVEDDNPVPNDASISLYDQAIEAHDEKNWALMIIVAIKLDIELPEEASDMLEQIKENTIELEQKISKETSSIAWQFYHAGKKDKTKT